MPAGVGAAEVAVGFAGVAAGFVGVATGLAGVAGAARPDAAYPASASMPASTDAVIRVFIDPASRAFP
jgi:hypothetical protein